MDRPEPKYNPKRFQKGEYLRVLEDIKWRAPMREFVDRQSRGEPTEKVVIPAGTVCKVIWAGRSFDKAIKGASKWRLGLVWPGRNKPYFRNQGFYGTMVAATREEYEAQVNTCAS